MKYVLIFTAICSGFSLMISCNQFKEVTCKEAAEDLRSDSCNIIVSEFSKNEYRYYLKGINPSTKKAYTFKRINYTWAYWFKNKIIAGDTVVKHGGALKFYIHKKDTVLVFPFECNGKIYE